MNSFKPNTRGAFIHERFITLEECLRDVDQDVYFDIEVSKSSRPASGTTSRRTKS